MNQNREEIQVEKISQHLYTLTLYIYIYILIHSCEENYIIYNNFFSPDILKKNFFFLNLLLIKIFLLDKLARYIEVDILLVKYIVKKYYP